MTVSDLGGRRAQHEARRAELAAFLKSRRARITPESVGLPAGSRRRTPGLRREEVAQLSGVGITWYTWLEQGRRISVSVQVLDAVARTLALDTAEKAHLYRLADIPTVPSAQSDGTLPPDIQTILDQLEPLPASVLSARYDVLASNAAYAALFPGCVISERNVLWEIFTTPACCNPFVTRADEVPRMVGYLRAAYGKNLHDPTWMEFVDRLCAASEEFSTLWGRNDVAVPAHRIRVVSNAAIGEVSMSLTSFGLPAPAGAWMQVFTPADAEAQDGMDRLMAMSADQRREPFLEHVQGEHPARAERARELYRAASAEV